MRLSTFLVLVALAAVFLAGVALRRRSEAFGRMALIHEVSAALGRRHPFGDTTGEVDRRARWISDHEALAAKYRRAASRPWLSAAQDPPVPGR